jgi:pimeloyl-ACP methyl ester carboxylesterase
MLRGLGRESGHWGPFLPALEAAARDSEVVTLDLPGAGTRLHDRAPRSIRRTVDRVRDEARARDLLRSPLLLFGISLGGMVAMEWAASHPEEVGGIAIAASSASDLAPLLQRFSLAGIATVVLNGLTRDPERRQRRIAWLVSNRRDIRDRVVHEWTQIERDRPVSFATLRAQMEAASRWRAPASLRVPSLFLVGRKDRLVHPACSRTLARRYGAPLEEHPDAGHDLTTDAPEWVAGHCVRWASQLVHGLNDRRI